jgi:hypothetical protein
MTFGRKLTAEELVSSLKGIVKSHLIFFLLFICAYNVWVFSPPHPLLPPLPNLPSASPPLPPGYQAETILPLSVILLKREYKQ